ncbi:hypothetical protein Ahia01_001114100 [Argonauta hians]
MSEYQLSINYEHKPPPENMDKDTLQRIKKLERLRERRFHESRSVRKMGLNGDLDQYGKQMENDMKTLKEIKKTREHRAISPVPRAISPLPPLFDISPEHTTRQNLFFGNEAYTKTRMEELRRMREENGHTGFTASEGLSSAVNHLERVNERINALRLKSSALQKEILEKKTDEVSASEGNAPTNPMPIPDITITSEETENCEE